MYPILQSSFSRVGLGRLYHGRGEVDAKKFQLRQGGGDTQGKDTRACTDIEGTPPLHPQGPDPGEDSLEGKPHVPLGHAAVLFRQCFIFEGAELRYPLRGDHGFPCAKTTIPSATVSPSASALTFTLAISPKLNSTSAKRVSRSPGLMVLVNCISSTFTRNAMPASLALSMAIPPVWARASTMRASGMHSVWGKGFARKKSSELI